MKTIKVYMNVDGSLQNGFTPDFNLNQYSWQDSLLNVYVPVSICDFDTGSTGVVCLFKSYDSEGELVEDISTNTYSFAYVKRGIYKSGDTTEYALFERTMPKQMTLYSGEQAICFNVNVYDSNNAITSIITSGDYTYTVVASSVKEESEESSDYDTLYAMYNSLKETTDDLEDTKQDKADVSISVYTDNTHSSTTQSVVYGLNYLNERTTNLETQVDTNTSDIAEIKENALLQENYLGTTTQESEPTNATLTTIALQLKGSALESGDVVIWVYSQEDATDTIYRCIWSEKNGWNWYALPDVEVASNTSMGLIQGTNTDSDTGVLKVDIVSGKVNNIYYYDTYEQTYKTLNASVSLLNEIVSKWYNGTTAVPKATADSNGNNIADTYMTQNLGATKDYVKNYALVKAFNDVNYLDFSTNTISTTLVESESSVSLSSIGTTSLATLTYVNSTYTYTLSQSNQLTGKLYYYTDVDMEDFTLTVNVVFHSSATDTAGTNVATYTSDTLSVSAGNIQAFTYSTNCALLGSETIDVVDGSYFTFEYIVNTTSDTATTFTMFTNETYPSLNQWAIAFGTVSFATGVVGEEDTHVITTYTSSENVATYSLGDEYILSANTEHYFELTYSSDFTSDTEIVLAIGNTTYPLVSKTNTYTTNATLQDLKDCKVYNGDTELYVLRFKAFYRNENGNAYFVVDNAYLQDIRDDITNLEEETAKSLYHLGAYDTYVDNGDGTTTITRQTGYVCGSKYTVPSTTQSGRVIYLYQNHITNRVYTDIVNNLGYEARDTTNWWQTDANLDDTKGYISFESTNSYIVVIPPVNTIPSDDLQIQYKLATSYTETVIQGKPLNTLDKQGSEWVREEWEKSSNLLPKNILTTVSSNNSYIANNVSFNLKAGTYTISTSDNALLSCNINLKNNANTYSLTIENAGVNAPKTFTITSDCEIITIYASIVTGTTNNNIMLNKGDHAYPYQEYNGDIIHEKDLEEVKTQVETNTTNIATNTNDIATNKTNIATNTNDIASLDTRLDTAESDIDALESNVSTNATNITNLTNRMLTAEGNITTLQNKHLYVHHIHISCTATLGGELYMTLMSTSSTAYTYTTLCEKLYAIATGVIASGEGIATSGDTTLTHINCVYEDSDVLYVRYQTAKNTHKNVSWTSTNTTVEDIPETIY